MVRHKALGCKWFQVQRIPDRDYGLSTSEFARIPLFFFMAINIFSRLAAANAQSTTVSIPRCFSSNGTFNDHIRGKWVLTPEDQIGTPKVMENIKCKTRGGGPRSCMSRARSQRDPVPVETGRSRIFEPSNCLLDPYSPSALETAIGPDRNIYLFGDSILMQQKSGLRCDTLSHLNSTSEGRTLYFTNGGKMTFYRVSTTKHLEKQLSTLKNSAMTSKDVCIFNVGVHYNSPLDYKKEFLDFFEANCLKISCLPCRITWRESSHQHFPGPTGGLFVKG
eukprot:7689357-Pyramimonas_sp.AAC.1